MGANIANGRFCQILLDHAARYPAWQIEDLYKLIHQASLGSEHAVADREQARRWLETELAHSGAASTEPLIDPISPGGSIVRVHLRPLAQSHLSPELLLDAFVQTSSAFHGSIQLLEEQWQEATALSTKGLLHFAPAELGSWIVRIREENYPAVHHSASYVGRYHPAYRVVASEYLPSEWGK